MDTSNSHISNAAPIKRGRKPKTDSQQSLAEARRSLALAQARHEKALARVERERMAELARKGRQIYLSAIEQLHAGERALIVDPVLASLPEYEQSVVQAWMNSLTEK